MWKFGSLNKMIWSLYLDIRRTRWKWFLKTNAILHTVQTQKHYSLHPSLFSSEPFIFAFVVLYLARPFLFVAVSITTLVGAPESSNVPRPAPSAGRGGNNHHGARCQGAASTGCYHGRTCTQTDSDGTARQVPAQTECASLLHLNDQRACHFARIRSKLLFALKMGARVSTEHVS